MSLPYETFLKDTTCYYSEFCICLTTFCVCVCERERERERQRERGFLCSATSLILREQDLGFLNVFTVHNSAKQKYSESVFLKQLLGELPFN